MEPTAVHRGRRRGRSRVGICGCGIIDVIAELYRPAASSTPRAMFVREGQPRRYGMIHGMGRYVLAFAARSRRPGGRSPSHEVDIDNFIRAKGAIFSAIDTHARPRWI